MPLLQAVAGQKPNRASPLSTRIFLRNFEIGRPVHQMIQQRSVIGHVAFDEGEGPIGAPDHPVFVGIDDRPGERGDIVIGRGRGRGDTITP